MRWTSTWPDGASSAVKPANTCSTINLESFALYRSRSGIPMPRRSGCSGRFGGT